MSWGISDCFRSLSLSKGQVLHALLTRPPLSLSSLDRSRIPISSVRLECVMHAASVHPEPGSNSRNICINSYLRTYQSSYSELWLALSYFVWVYTLQELTRYSIHAFFALYLYLLLFDFQWPFTIAGVPSPRQLAYYITPHTLLSSTFFYFFWFFCFFVYFV